MVLHFWETGEVPEEWETGLPTVRLLAILPKKGDLSQPGNYRGIMMLEVAYKIVANLLNERLEPVIESLDHEAQCGFRRKRGCSDAIFTVRQLIAKRREHGLETWILFIDLVKAFDRVPRELLWQVMLKYGVPPKIVSLLIALHELVHVKFEIDGVVRVLLSIIGVKQGDLLGPGLFIFYICAIMETWRAEHTYDLCIFRSRDDYTMTGRQPTAHGDDFAIVDSEYADDTALPFASRKDVEEQTPEVITHFSRWGMEVHFGIYAPDGSVAKESKSETLFCAARAHMYADPATFDGADLSDVLIPGGRFMPIVSKFKYLGSCTLRSCNDAIDVDSRIESAGKAFGALRGCVFSSTHINVAAKHAVYEVLHPCHPPLRRRELERNRGDAAAAARLPCAVRAQHVPRVSQAHTAAPHLDGGVGEATGPRLDRHLPLATAAALGRARQSDGLCAAAASAHAFLMGAAPAHSRGATDDVRPQPRQRAERLPHRPSRVASACGEPHSVARDAAPRPPARLAARAADAAARAPAADPQGGHRRQRQHRRVAARAPRTTPTVVPPPLCRCAVKLSWTLSCAVIPACTLCAHYRCACVPGERGSGPCAPC
mmetsp:Transcript_64854/g.193832  ORF Transcript_64854/g.193832 Transcript_64854/m.193832 type:complete len:601 (-) Transcript_64854:243-2045(-)